MDIKPRFISAGKDFSTYQKHVNAPYLRKSFTLEASPENAVLTISGLGFYQLYINGEDITKGFLAPYISNTDDYVYFDRYDVSGKLHKGENVIGILLGNGFQNAIGGGIWDLQKAVFRSAPKMALHLDTDGTVTESDESFKTAPSPILFDDERCGCFYDARLEQKGWNLPGFDDSGWDSAFFAENPRGEYKLCEAEPITVNAEIKPVCVTQSDYTLTASSFDHDKRNTEQNAQFKTETGTVSGYLYDFGVNTSGVWKLKIKNPEKGQKIILQAGEKLTDGKLDISSLMHFYPTGYFQRDIYICKGEAEEEFIPFFTYHGCRYCHVSGITPEQADAELLTLLEIHSALESRGSFSCSDPMADKLQEITLRSARSNFVYFPTDCPHREKNGWTGDAAYSCEYVTLNFAAENSYREWLHNIRKTQRQDGSLPGIIPTASWGYDWGNGPAWDRVLIYLPYYTYIYRGCKDIIQENAHAIFRYLCYLTTQKNESGLFAFGLGDWCPPGRGAGDYEAPLALTDSVMVMSICEKASYLFGEIGWTLQKKFADDLYTETRNAVRRHLIDFSTMIAAGSCQTAQAIAIFYDVLEPAEKQAAFKQLLRMIHEEDGGHMTCGYIGNRVLFHVLSMYNESELAYEMITRPDYPSYAYPVLQYDATTLWEMYHETETGSLNHHFFGDISNWFITRVAGIQVNPLRRNVNEFYIKPAFVQKLNFAKAHYNAVCGQIQSCWERKKENILLTVIAPENAAGKIILPNGYEFVTERTSPIERRGLDGLHETVLKSGEYTIRKI